MQAGQLIFRLFFVSRRRVDREFCRKFISALPYRNARRRQIILESIDRGVSLETTLDRIHELAHEPRLELLSKLVYFFKPETGFTMTTESKAPAGAGLAGSSTLNIACIGALNKLVGDRYAPEKFIPIAAAIECRVIKVPTGYQDYYSAQYGGIASIHFGPDGMKREALEVDIETLQNRIAVCYTGEPRNSGTNNWDITKRHIDGDNELFDIFEGIRDDSINLREALLANDWERVGEILKPRIRIANASRRQSRRRRWIC